MDTFWNTVWTLKRIAIMTGGRTRLTGSEKSRAVMRRRSLQVARSMRLKTAERMSLSRDLVLRRREEVMLCRGSTVSRYAHPCP